MAATATWQETLAASAEDARKGTAFKKRAGVRLWEGAQAGITAWDQASDSNAERLYAEALDALGNKGQASKIATVARAVKDNGLNMAQFLTLAAAYGEAIRLTKTVKVQAAEDDAAEDAVQNLSAPKSTSSPEGAAKIVLSKGVDDAARLLLDALGPENDAAHRALLRAISQEIQGRVKKPEPVAKKVAAPKAVKKATKAAPAKAAVKSGAAKPKPVKVEAPVENSTEAAPVQTAAKPKAKPVVRRATPVKRG